MGGGERGIRYIHATHNNERERVVGLYERGSGS